VAKVYLRSGLEDRIQDQLKLSGVRYYYETEKIPYKVPASSRKYTPDFIIYTKSGKKIYIEGKGIWDYQDRYKHLLIRKQHPNLDIRFVFSNSKSKIRKGSPTTYADICNGIGRPPFKGHIWKFSNKKVPKEWLNE